MSRPLTGKRIAFLATHGVEQIELTEPRRVLEEAGAETEIIALDREPIQAYDHADKSDLLPVDRAVAEADPGEYDGLVLPGGVRNPDHLRQDPAAVALVRELFTAGKPVGVICHGPWTLIEAGVLKGRTITSYPSLRTDIRNAGAHWVDRELVNDEGLISSRGPQDLPAFCAALVDEITGSSRDGRTIVR
jgi:protease I